MSEKNKTNLQIWTDGSCSVNTGQGGWAYIVVLNDEVVRTESGAATDTTNNRMELTAVLEAIKFLEQKFAGTPLSYNIYTDSAYICNCFKDKWYERWMVNGWRNATRVPVKNKDLWEPLIEKYLNSPHAFFILKVAGHADNYYNNRADLLAKEHREYEEAIDTNWSK